MRISSIAKSIVAGLAAGATAAVTAVQDGALTTGEGVTIALVVLGAWGPGTCDTGPLPPSGGRGPFVVPAGG
ncbi:hypothetical protein AB0933_27895 [Streptomyces venezuelae]|uniref:hypothetical protein n=1 Tax=Streptomyces venezuelae TaxID=54571 RepID=UPI003456131E